MMAAQRERMSCVLPDKIVVRNKKDQLYNDMLMMIEKNGLKCEVNSGTASNVLSSLCDALWYVDGHHQTFAGRILSIPEIFSNFTGYNQPEKLKHKKRLAGSMCAGTLKSHSQRLFGNLQLPFWDRGDWKRLKTDTEQFAANLGDYADILNVKKQNMNDLHQSSSPARSIGEDLLVEFLTPRHSVSPEIAIFQENMESSGINVAVEIDKLLPM